MDTSTVRVLLVEDDEDDYVATRTLLTQGGRGRVALDWVATYDAALEAISRNRHDAYLLDYRLGARDGLELLREAVTTGCTAPIIMLTGQEDRAVDLAAMQAGAADYLIKGQITAALIERSLRYAIERHRLQTELRSLALTDALTGLYSRRGFLTLAGQQLKLAARTQRGLVLTFADLDGLKRINDTYDHQEGDVALIVAAEVLRKTFRDSDIVARLGGDEFAVLAIEAARESAAVIPARLQKNLADYNAQHRHPYTLSISLGVAVPDLTIPASVEKLLAQADQALYAQKHRKRSMHPQ